MICPNCGREIPDGSICPCMSVPAALSDNPALNVVKTVGSSPLFLAMVVLYSLSALLTIASSAASSDTFANLYYTFYTMGLDMSQVEAILDTMRSTSVVSAVMGSIPAILTAVAMWIHFSTCKNRQTGNISTAGLTICKVLAYIRMITLCLVTLLLLGILALAIVGILMGSFVLPNLSGPEGFSSSYSDEEATLAVVIVLGIFALIFAFAMVLAITYQASYIRTINRAKQVAQTGMADDRVSGYLMVMSGFSAVCCGIYGLVAMTASLLSGVATLAQAAALVLMILLLRNYRQQMNQVLFPPVMPVMPMGYPAAPMNGAPEDSSQVPPAEQ